MAGPLPMCFQRPARKGGVGKAGLKNGRLTSEWRTADMRFKRNYAADSPRGKPDYEPKGLSTPLPRTHASMCVQC